jgi:hypothetical protein
VDNRVQHGCEDVDFNDFVYSAGEQYKGGSVLRPDQVNKE